jgi:hypothetical protein
MIPAIKQRCAIMSLSFERRHVIDYTMWLAIDGGILKNIRFKRRTRFSNSLTSILTGCPI